MRGLMKKTYFEYEDGDEYVIPSVKVQEGPEEFGCGFCWDKRKKQTKERKNSQDCVEQKSKPVFFSGACSAVIKNSCP